jgi:serine/threonine protein kinase
VVERPGDPRLIERIAGYRVVRRLALGGTSDVLLAQTESPQGFARTVVLKILVPQLHDDEKIRKRFEREAWAYTRLADAAIVKLHDFLAVDGRLVMVLEHVDGATLTKLRGMLSGVGATIGDEAAIHVAAQAFSALAAAHAMKGEDGASCPLVHRDVNPSNLLVGWNGDVKLGDFGLAVVTALQHESVAGLASGTYGYMAPEQVLGTELTARTDVYAAALVLWELLARRRAFPRMKDQLELARAMATPSLASLDALRPDLDAELRGIVASALAPQPEDRAVTAAEIVKVLRARVPPERGRELVADLMARVRHEPPPALTAPPPAPSVSPAPDVVMRSSETMSMSSSTRASVRPAADLPPPRWAAATNRTSSARLIAARATSSARVVVAKRTSSMKMPQAHASAAPPPPPSPAPLAAEEAAPRRDPRSFHGLERVLAFELPGGRRSEPDVDVPVVEGSVAEVPPAQEANAAVDVPVDVSVVEPLPDASRAPPSARILAWVDDARPKPSLAAALDALPRLATPSEVDAADDARPAARVAPAPEPDVRRARRRARRAALLGVAFATVVGALAADRLGYLRLPYHDRIAALEAAAVRALTRRH